MPFCGFGLPAGAPFDSGPSIVLPAPASSTPCDDHLARAGRLGSDENSDSGSGRSAFCGRGWGFGSGL